MNESNDDGVTPVVVVGADAVVIGGNTVVVIDGCGGGAGGPNDCGIVAGELMRRTGSESVSTPRSVVEVSLLSNGPLSTNIYEISKR
jgi:hypothetical protein